jgi:hypothetical protein
VFRLPAGLSPCLKISLPPFSWLVCFCLDLHQPLLFSDDSFRLSLVPISLPVAHSFLFFFSLSLTSL